MTLKELRAKLLELQGRATAKLAEIKDDTAADKARAIEAEHQEIVTEIERVNAQITEAERAEAATAQTRENPGPAAPAVPGAAPAAPAAAAPAVDTEAVRTAVREGINSERTRADTVTALGARFGQSEFAVEHVRAGTPVAEFRTKLMDKLAASSEEIRIVPHVQVGRQDETVTRREAAANALLHRHNPVVFKLTDAGRQYRGMTLLELARDMIEASGTSTRGMARDEIAKRSFMSTSDFPSILEAVTNKTLRQAYDAYPNTFRNFCRQVNATDFKDQNRVQLGEAPQLEKVNESGEFKRGSITESKEKYRIATYGKVVAITRQVIINDDLGAFTRIPSMFGIAIATLEGDIVWSIVTANAAMADGVALFHATHKNLVSGVGNVGAPSVTTVSATRKLLRQQKGLDGKTKISVVPRFLIVPTELETVAEQLVTVITPAQTDKVVPDSMRKLIPISEPRLDDSSATAWYLAANPTESNIDTIEFAYLEGQEGAYMETRLGFEVDGMEVKCRLDFGAKAIDWRGMAKNPGV